MWIQGQKLNGPQQFKHQAHLSKLLLISPRNSPRANLSLLHQTSCRRVYHSEIMASAANALGALDPELSFTRVPSFDELISFTSKEFEYLENFDAAVRHPVLIVHSSGSTGEFYTLAFFYYYWYFMPGLPKPITLTHGSFATVDYGHNRREIPGRKRHDFNLWNMKPFGRFYTMFPTFHVG